MARLDRDSQKGGFARRITFGEQERIVGGIDNSGERGAAFLAIQPITFKTAGIDLRMRAAAEVEPRMALRAVGSVARRAIARRCGRKLVSHRQPTIRKTLGDVFYRRRTEIVLKADPSNTTIRIDNSLTKRPGANVLASGRRN